MCPFTLAKRLVLGQTGLVCMPNQWLSPQIPSPGWLDSVETLSLYSGHFLWVLLGNEPCLWGEPLWVLSSGKVDLAGMLQPVRHSGTEPWGLKAVMSTWCYVLLRLSKTSVWQAASNQMMTKVKEILIKWSQGQTAHSCLCWIWFIESFKSHI